MDAVASTRTSCSRAPRQGAASTVNRWHPDGYLEVLSAERGQTVRAEPFDAIEIAVGALFGDEPEA